MSELKVGTKVRIKTDLVVGVKYGGISIVSDMEQYKGLETEISMHESAECYILEWCGIWSWTPEMFDVIE